MKDLTIMICLFFLLTACGQTAAKKSEEKSRTHPSVKKAVALFLDSTLLEAFIEKRVAEKTTAGLLRSFYKNRNYQFAWFNESGIAENMQSFWTFHNTYIQDFNDTSLQYMTLHQEIDALLKSGKENDTSTQTRVLTELSLTVHSFVYLNNAYAGKADPAVMQWHIPRKKLDVVTLLNSFLALDGKNLNHWEPVNLHYKRLKKELLHYAEIEKQGGWRSVSLES